MFRRREWFPIFDFWILRVLFLFLFIFVKRAKMNANELLQEQLDIEDEMNGEEEDEDTDADLLIQALRDRIRAAAYLQVLGQKLPFGFHFGIISSLPNAQDGPKKAHDVEEVQTKKSASSRLQQFVCPEKKCGAKFSSRALLNAHAAVHQRRIDDDDDDEEEQVVRLWERIPKGITITLKAWCWQFVTQGRACTHLNIVGP